MGEFNKALNYSFFLLRYRARAKKEIKTRLKIKKFSSSAIEEVLNFLEDHKIIDDESFAASFVREKLNRGFSKRKISFDLRRLGMAQNLINKELNRIEDTPYINMIRDIIKKRRKRYTGNKDIKGKIFRYLLQRGFNLEDIKEAFNEDR